MRCFPADFAEKAEQTDARTLSQRSRHNCGVPIVIFPADLTTHEERTRRGPEICTRRHFGVIAEVVFPSEVTVRAETIPTTEDKLDRASGRQGGPG